MYLSFDLISDLHLGLEALMASGGVYLPKFQLDEMKDDIKEIIKKVNPKKMIINGDIKHEFSETTWEEREEVRVHLREKMLNRSPHVGVHVL